MYRHLSTCNISSKSMHAFLSNLANRQTNEHEQKHVRPPQSEVMTRYTSNMYYISSARGETTSYSVIVVMLCNLHLSFDIFVVT